MKRSLLILLSILPIILFFSSCEKKIINKYQTKVVGTWQFEKVSKNSTIGNNSNFYTRLWEGYQITFLADGSASLYNSKNMETYYGDYFIDKSNLEIDEDYPYYLDIEILKNNERENYLWYFRNVNSKTLKVLSYDDDDTYYYRLSKIN